LRFKNKTSLYERPLPQECISKQSYHSIPFIASLKTAEFAGAKPPDKKCIAFWERWDYTVLVMMI
jgi:hypothetical protein